MEYRVTCSKHEQVGHQLHHWNKLSKDSATQTVTDANHKAELDTHDLGFYNRVCAPYRVETREVTEWTAI